MSQEILPRNGDHQILVALHHALAGQAGGEARVYRPINKILFLVRNLGQVVHSRLYIYVAGAATAYPAAIVLELNIVVEGHIKHRFAFGGHVRLVRLTVSKLKRNIYNFHEVQANSGAKVVNGHPDSNNHTILPRIR